MEDHNKSALFDSKQEGILRLSDGGGRIQRQLSWNVDKAKISDSSYQPLFQHGIIGKLFILQTQLVFSSK